MAARTSFPVELLGDLDSLAHRYNQLWLNYERQAKSTPALRLRITAALLKELNVGDQAIAAQLSHAFRDIRQETGTCPYPGIEALLTDLKTKYKLGLYTNGPSDMQREKMDALGFNRFFDVILIAGAIDIYKPDPEGFHLLLRQLDVDPKECLFVGDTVDTDIVGAHSVGMPTCWVKHTERAPLHDIEPTLTMSNTALLREVLL